MKEILEEYSTRLINVSGRNRSLVTRKLYKKRAFDIVKLGRFQEGISKELIKFLCERDEAEFEILEDPYKWYTQEHLNLKELIEKDKKKELEKYEFSGKKLTEEEFKLIQHKYENKFLEDDEKLNNTKESMIDSSNSIKVLIKEIVNTEKETGRYELFIGYPFVEGYFKDKTFIKAPLFLFPIEVIKKGDGWNIINKLDSKIILNKVFLIGYAKYNEEKLVDIETEYDELKSFGTDLVKGSLEALKKVNIHIVNSTDEISTFKEVTKATEPNYNLGELNIKKNIIMGHFNIANSIYKDYKEMEDGDLSNGLMYKLLKNDDKNQCDIDRDDNCRYSKDILEKDFYFMSDLDYSQEIAVMKSAENSQLVIYGPPGTGKSQTIVNIISQYLSNGKRVLMVSQKKAALDVIFNRSSAINSKMIMFNKEIDKKQFYSRIANRISGLNEGELNEKYLEKMSNAVDEDINKLKGLGDVLTKKRSFGLTIQEMYNKPRINYNNETLNKFFREFRKAYPFEGFTYDELIDIKENLLNKDKALKFYNLKHIMGNNMYALFIKENIELYDLEDSIEAINKLICEYETIICDLKDKVRYFNESKHIVINNLPVESVAKRIAQSEYGELLDKLTIGSKFSLKYWLNLRKNKAKEEENLKLFEKKVSELVLYINNEVSIIKGAIEKLSFLNDVLVIEEVDKLKIQFEDVNLIVSSLSLILEVLKKHGDISYLKGTVNDIKEKELKVIEYLYSMEQDYEKAKYILDNIHLLSNQVYIGRLQREYGRELESIDNYEDLRKDVSEAMQRKRKAVPEYINQKWDNNALNIKKNQDKLWTAMFRECNKKRRLLQIREFVSRFQECIFELYPCWLLSPETVSEVLPLSEGLFDLIIFDEASQMFIEASIPTIYRGKSIVVAGDDKQLRPSSTFNSKYEDEEDEYDIESGAALEEESLLDLSKCHFDSTSLYYHYRSKYDELINFSNYAFYDGKLEVSPNILRTEISKEKPIERIKVEGKWVDRRNPVEAQEVVRLVKDILMNREHEETVGIITFNITQRDIIDRLLEIEAGKDAYFGSKYYDEVERTKDNEDISLFIKNIENVQGDERDIIIFSTAYAKNEKGKVTASFGSLSQDGGENRLNVAISRAKEKIYVVTSIEPEDLNVDNSKNNGPKLLKKYLQYVRAISDGNKDMAQEVLYSVCDSSMGRTSYIHYDSDFENQVYDELQRAGLIVDTQIGVSGYKIDLGIYDEESSRYILGIECDGAAYHSSKSARERDIYRQRYLESRGWNIIRIWSKDWWNNPKKEIDRIINKVNEILEGKKNNI